MAHRNQKRWPGFVLVIVGAIFWGVGERFLNGYLKTNICR